MEELILGKALMDFCGADSLSQNQVLKSQK
jgi:hypothetical protein